MKFGKMKSLRDLKDSLGVHPNAVRYAIKQGMPAMFRENQYWVNPQSIEFQKFFMKWKAKQETKQKLRENGMF